MASKQIYKITVLNWVEHNPGTKKHYKKTLIANNLTSDAKINALPLSCKWLFINLLLICGDYAKDTVTLTERQVNDILTTREGANNALDRLVYYQLVSYQKNDFLRIEKKEKKRRECGNSTCVEKGSIEPPPPPVLIGLENPKPIENFNHEKQLAEDQVSHAWIYFCVPHGFSKPNKWTSDRQKKAKNISKKFSKADIETAAEKIAASSFCRGQNDRGWKADIDFFLNEKKLVKVLEGFYDDKTPNAPQPSKKFELKL